MRATKTATEVRREQIAEAALALLGSSHGADPGIAEIARRVGVVPSAVYRHYRGKDAILEAALDLVEGRLQESIALARQDTGDPLARIQGLFARHAGLLAGSPGLPQLLLARGVFGDSAARRQRVANVMRGYLGAVAEIVREGQRSGHLRGDLAPQTAALIFLGMLLPAVVMREVRGGAFDVAAHACAVWPALASALAPQAAPAACGDKESRTGAARPRRTARTRPTAAGERRKQGDI